MRKKNAQKYFFYGCLLLATLFLFPSPTKAQLITKTYQIPQFEILQIQYDDNRVIKRLTFEGATSMSEFPVLPLFWDQVEVNQLYTSYKYTLSNAQYQALTPEQIALIPADYNVTEPEVRIKTATERGKHFAMVHISTIIKNASGQYQRLASCELRFEGADPSTATKGRGLRNSVLTSGTWYKIAVANTGLHKVTYNDLKALGVDVANLRSSSIALFGNGGGIVPEINPAVQIDDLLECPIMVSDNGGTFNENSYFVFYAQGPHTWTPNADGSRFTHNFNIYAEQAYYFINVDAGIGQKKRIVTQEDQTLSPNGTATYFVHYDFYENDKRNFGEAGREWFDDPIYASNSKTYNFTLPELLENKARLKIRAATNSTTLSNMSFSWGTHTESFTINPASGLVAVRTFENDKVSVSSGGTTLTLKYNSSQGSAAAYLDYIEIQAKCRLKITGGAMPFAITENIGASNITSVTMANASAQTKIWDVTDHNAVFALQGSLAGTQFSFKTPTTQPRRFIAFNGTSYQSVTPVGKVTNQNLHGFKDVAMVIVTHPNFITEANRLAQFRAKENNIEVKVVTPQQVYNEFSSGAQDVSAIRNFMRYLYDNDNKTIKYLLLFGRPSYDYRSIVEGTQIFVPNYQERFSDNYLNSEADSFDDFFGILDEGEGDMSKDLIDIAVGRFPVTNATQSRIAVEKTMNASARYSIATQNASQVSNLGDWRNVIALVADNDDAAGDFVLHAESAAEVVASNFPAGNLDKIYMDSYPQVSFAGGVRHPGANKALTERMARGALAISYFGHGGGNGWAHERILEIADISNFKNKYNQPFMVTITCSFGWYDKPAISPAELVFLNDNGGAIGLITTSRVTGSDSAYGNSIYNEITTKGEDGKYKTIGEIHQFAKNKIGGTGSGNMIYLIGDPALRINIPHQKVQTIEILGEDQQKIDTLKALTKVTVKGQVTDDAGNILTGFNGKVYPSIFDKSVMQKTLGQAAITPVREFMVQKNVIFKGNATVKDGIFEFSFFVPKDINFEYGNGKISYYAASNNDDGEGYYDEFIIGGMSDKPLEDNNGPEVSIFLNDDKFVHGGITNPDPVLILKLKDEYGINTTGNGIGHDLVALLDNNVEKQMVLNDFYLADQDSYNSGTVRYPLQGLSPGLHTLKVRAWDINNNPSEAVIDFVVKTDEKLELANVLNYPNPFTTKTTFLFEHNQPMETFDVLLHIFTISGKLVKTINISGLFLEGTNNHKVSNLFDWDGRDDFGDKIGKGVYLYRLTVRNSQGQTAEKIEKIAIL